VSVGPEAANCNLKCAVFKVANCGHVLPGCLFEFTHCDLKLAQESSLRRFAAMIAASKVYRVEAGDFVYNRLFALEGFVRPGKQRE
jgi:hypothetical protein